MSFTGAGIGEGEKEEITQGNVIFITRTLCTTKQEAASRNYESDYIKEAEELQLANFYSLRLLSSTLVT